MHVSMAVMHVSMAHMNATFSVIHVSMAHVNAQNLLIHVSMAHVDSPKRPTHVSMAHMSCPLPVASCRWRVARGSRGQRATGSGQLATDRPRNRIRMTAVVGGPRGGIFGKQAEPAQRVGQYREGGIGRGGSKL